MVIILLMVCGVCEEGRRLVCLCKVMVLNVMRKV